MGHRGDIRTDRGATTVFTKPKQDSLLIFYFFYVIENKFRNVGIFSKTDDNEQ